MLSNASYRGPFMEVKRSLPHSGWPPDQPLSSLPCDQCIPVERGSGWSWVSGDTPTHLQVTYAFSLSITSYNGTEISLFHSNTDTVWRIASQTIKSTCSVDVKCVCVYISVCVFEVVLKRRRRINIAASSNYRAKHYRSKHQTNCSNE